MRAAVALVAVLVLAGCGTPRATTTTTSTRHAAPKPPPAGLRVGIVGDLQVPKLAGAVQDHGTLAQVADDPLVLVGAGAPAAGQLGGAATAHPSTHFMLVGGSARDLHMPNVAGLVIRDDQAAYLAGLVAGIVAGDEGVEQPRVGWAGPQDTALADAFARGAHAVEPRALILHAWSSSVPAACKEAALAVVQRGAVAVLSPHGTCAAAAASGAHEQNVVALSLDDFELPAVPASQAVEDAVAGVYHGGEDLVYGAASGAVAVRALDPRITPDEAIRARQLASGIASSG